MLELPHPAATSATAVSNDAEPTNQRFTTTSRLTDCLPDNTDAQRAPDVSAVCVVAALLGRDGLQLAQCREPGQSLALELADALTRQIELVADRLEGPGLAVEADAQFENPRLALGKRV